MKQTIKLGGAKVRASNSNKADVIVKPRNMEVSQPEKETVTVGNRVIEVCKIDG